MTTRPSKSGSAFRPLVNFSLDLKWLPDLNAKIAECDAEWLLGGCIMGFVAPVQKYPLTPEEYALQAWLLYAKLFPEKAGRLLKLMNECA